MATPSENMTVIDGYALANPFERIIAFLIDLVFFGILYAGLSRVTGLIGNAWAGALLAFIYLIFRDNMPFLKHQSLGKKIMKLKVIRSDARMQISLLEAVKRNFLLFPNLIFAFNSLYVYPVFTLFFILILIELYFLYTSSDYQRLGDQFADTIVIENSI